MKPMSEIIEERKCLLFNDLAKLNLSDIEDADKACDLIELALKEQDRDTRHACAEAVVKLNESLRISGQYAWKDKAHAACMNASCKE